MVPEEIVNRVREATDIVQVVSQYVSLKKAGANYKGLCPFHQEKTPSFTVHAGKQIYHCFGCGQGGNVFKFLMGVGKMTFPETLKELAEKAGIALPENGGPSRAETQAQEKQRAALHELNQLAAAWFRRNLLEGKEAEAARAYARKRGLSAEIMERFQLGYSPDDGQALLKAAKAKGYGEDKLLEAGLAVRNEAGRIYARFRGRLMFPIQDATGKMVGFGGRLLGPGEPKYLNSPETPVFAKGSLCFALPQAKETIQKRKQALVVEGYMDALACHQAGLEFCVATLGTALGEAHGRLLKRYAEEVVLVFDTDRAGVAAARRASETLAGSGLGLKVLRLPGAKDPDEFLSRNGAQAFLDLMSSPKGALDPAEFFLATALDENPEPDFRSRAGIIQSLFPVLAKSPTEMEADAHLRRAARRLGLGEEAVLEDFASFKKGREQKALARMAPPSQEPSTAGEVPAGKSASASRSRLWEREFLSILADRRDLSPLALRLCVPEDFDDLQCREAFRLLTGHPETPVADLPADEPLAGFLRETLLSGKPQTQPERSLQEISVSMKVARLEAEEKRERGRMVPDTSALARLGKEIHLLKKQKFGVIE
jgi:DNA primase